MPTLDKALLGQAVDKLYEGAMEPRLWGAAMDAVSKAVGGIGMVCMYFPQEHDTHRYACSPILEDPMRAFLQGGWLQHNVRMSKGVSLTRSGRCFVTERMLLEPDEWDRQPIQAEFFRPNGLRSFVGFDLVPGRMLASIERGFDEVAPWELSALDLLAPHLGRIGRMAMARGTAAADGILDGLALLDRAALLLDHGGKVVGMNAAAEQLFPTALGLRQGKLFALHRGADQALRSLLAGAVLPVPPREAPIAPAVRLPRTSAQPLIAHAMPITGEAQGLFHQAAAVLFLIDPDRRRPPNLDLLRAAFDLTRGEARLAAILAEGRDLFEAAGVLGVSRSTTRSHLRAIFAKTRTRRQGELVAVLSRVCGGG